MKEYKHHTDDKLTQNYFTGFLKTVYMLGIQDKNRFYFWKMILTCIFKYPKSLPKAMTQAIFFAHFEKIFTNEICETNVEKPEVIPISSAILNS